MSGDMHYKGSYFVDPGKPEINTFWGEGQISDFQIFIDSVKKKRLLFDRFCSRTKAHCLRTTICWSIKFHIVKKNYQNFKKAFSQKGFLQISFLNSHNSVSFLAREQEKSHLTLNFSLIITLEITPYRQS